MIKRVEDDVEIINDAVAASFYFACRPSSHALQSQRRKHLYAL